MKACLVLVEVEMPKRKKFNPDGTGYDLDTARAAGMKRDGRGHMGSVVRTKPAKARELGLPENSYLLLKGARHETFHKAVEAERKRGFRLQKARDGRYYSVPARKR